jgi:hypothetical protein
MLPGVSAAGSVFRCCVGPGLAAGTLVLAFRAYVPGDCIRSLTARGASSSSSSTVTLASPLPANRHYSQSKK